MYKVYIVCVKYFIHQFFFYFFPSYLFILLSVYCLCKVFSDLISFICCKYFLVFCMKDFHFYSKYLFEFFGIHTLAVSRVNNNVF